MLRKSREIMNYHGGFLRVLQLRSTFWKTLHKDFSIKSCQSKSSFKWFITIILSTYDERLHTLEVDKHAYLARYSFALQYEQVEETFSKNNTSIIWLWTKIKYDLSKQLLYLFSFSVFYQPCTKIRGITPCFTTIYTI